MAEFQEQPGHDPAMDALAKGLHEPFGLLNLLIYKYIPGMTMFREPTSKFTMTLIPFIALLIGYSADHIVNMTTIRNKTMNLTKTLTTLLIISSFIIATYPLLTTPLETRTQQYKERTSARVAGPN